MGKRILSLKWKQALIRILFIQGAKNSEKKVEEPSSLRKNIKCNQKSTPDNGVLFLTVKNPG